MYAPTRLRTNEIKDFRDRLAFYRAIGPREKSMNARDRERGRKNWFKKSRERFILSDLSGGIVYGPESSLSHTPAAPFLRYNCRFCARAHPHTAGAVLFCSESSVSPIAVRNSHDRIPPCEFLASPVPSPCYRCPFSARTLSHRSPFLFLLCRQTLVSPAAKSSYCFYGSSSPPCLHFYVRSDRRKCALLRSLIDRLPFS